MEKLHRTTNESVFTWNHIWSLKRTLSHINRRNIVNVLVMRQQQK